MEGNLLNRPRRGGDDSTVTSEALDVRRQIEHDLVAKIESTLQPLLGPNKFRAGASVDCDLSSGDQQEETFDPEKSVMVSTQKTEDGSERSSAGGIPGTAANLPNGNKGNGGNTSGNTHRTENITYQSSRVIRHTRIPQGVIRRMSLSILVGQDMRWEGDAKNKRRVYIPPSAETLEKIKTLIAGITGYNQERGDQLIVETLPFESYYDGDVARNTLQAPKNVNTDPQWMQVLNRYRNQIIGVLVGLAILSILLRFIGVRRRDAAAKSKEPEINREIERAMNLPSLQVAASGAAANVTAGGEAAADNAELSAGAKALLNEKQEEATERIRNLAQRDTAATANVLRMWLEQKT
jgi:flagellar M-ring protein FliF